MEFIPQFILDGRGGEFKLTEKLERQIAKFLGVKHCIMTTSGFAALFLAAKALGAKKVAVPALTMIATATAAELAGCEVVFYDNMPPEDVDTTMIVHLNGRLDMYALTYAKQWGHKIIEDACQAFGSFYDMAGPRALGTFGEVGCFSFQAYKLLSSGNGGCCVTNNDELAEKIRKLKNFGRVGGGDIHDEIGYNFKFNDIQAKVLLKELKSVDQKIAKKKHIYSEYQKYLKDYMLPHDGTPWFVDIYIQDIHGLTEHLFQNGIGVRHMYPLIPSQKAYEGRLETMEERFPYSWKLSQTGMWLPSSLSLTDEAIKYISDKVLEYVRK